MLTIGSLHNRFCIYSEVHKGNTKQTIQWFHTCYKSFSQFTNISYIHEVTKDIVETWLYKAYKERGWCAKTRKNRLSGMSIFFKWCVDREGCLKDNPTQNIDLPKVPKKIIKPLPLQKAIQVVEWAKHYGRRGSLEQLRVVAIITMFLFTGIRKEELRHIKARDVDYATMNIHIRSGKGQKDRLMPIPDSLEKHLKAYDKAKKKLGIESIYFFTSLQDNAMMGQYVIPRLFAKLQKRSGMNFYPHKLRRTYANMMRDAGTDILRLKDLMGHSCTESTEGYLTRSSKVNQELSRNNPLNGRV